MTKTRGLWPKKSKTRGLCTGLEAQIAIEHVLIWVISHSSYHLWWDLLLAVTEFNARRWHSFQSHSHWIGFFIANLPISRPSNVQHVWLIDLWSWIYKNDTWLLKSGKIASPLKDFRNKVLSIKQKTKNKKVKREIKMVF